MHAIRRSSMWKRCACGASIGSVLLLAGCGTTRVAEAPADAAAEAIPFPIVTKDIILGPGDMVEVKFYYTPELNELQKVRPDGKISMQLVGEVMASGLTPAQLQQTLRDLYTPRLENAEVTVVTRELNSRAVFVGGAVRQPGRLDMPASLTALHAILMAGGFNADTARLNKILVVRQVGAQPTVHALDLRRSLDGKETFYLEPQDIVYVPQTVVTDVNRWIDQHINKIVPQIGFTVFEQRGKSTVGIDTSR